MADFVSGNVSLVELVVRDARYSLRIDDNTIHQGIVNVLPGKRGIA